jgi:hypothetical protein
MTATHKFPMPTVLFDLTTSVGLGLWPAQDQQIKHLRPGPVSGEGHPVQDVAAVLSTARPLSEIGHRRRASRIGRAVTESFLHPRCREAGRCSDLPMKALITSPEKEPKR